MSAMQLLDDATRAGVRLEVHGGRLRLKAAAPPPPSLVEEIRRHKAELVDFLARRDERDEFEERAAIVEEGAGVPREWAEGFAKLCTMPRPKAIAPDRWAEIIDDAGRLLDEWGAKAAELGWTPEELFGCDERTPDRRHDRKGLALLVRGGRVVAMDRETAEIEMPGGGRLVYRRAGWKMPGPPAWTLARKKGPVNGHA